MPELNVGPDNYILKNPVTGEFSSVPRADADTAAAQGGLQYAQPEEIDRYNLEQRRGGGGQVALGLAEKAARTVSLGKVTSLSGSDAEARERAKYNEREYPTTSAVAGSLPGVAAAIATGGADLPLAAGVAAQGAIGGLTNLGGAHDEAFQRDEKLSTEAAWGSFGSGVLLGGGAELGLTAIGKAAGAVKGAVRNRFIEASGQAARKSEAAAFEQAGIVAPAEGLSKAVNDPVAAATLRKTAEEARPAATQEFDQAIGQAQAAHDAVTATHTPQPEVNGDILAQRHAVREVIDGLRTDVEGIGTQADKGVAARAMESLDGADTSAEVYDVLRQARAEMRRNLDLSADPDIAKYYTKWEAKARDLEESNKLFGAPANDVAAINRALGDAGQARSQLADALRETDYLHTAGTAAGKTVDDALDNYAEKLRAVLKGNDSTDAKQGLEALQKIEALRSGPLRDVAAGNQIDALGETVAPKGVKGPMTAGDMFGHALDLAGDFHLLPPGAGLVRKAWKYRAHVARLVGSARGDTEAAADALLGGSAKASRGAQEGASGGLAEGISDAAPKSPEYQAARSKVDAMRARQGESGAVTLGKRDGALYGKLQSAYDKFSDSLKGPDADALFGKLEDLHTEIGNAHSKLESKLADLAGAADEYGEAAPPPDVESSAKYQALKAKTDDAYARFQAIDDAMSKVRSDGGIDRQQLLDSVKSVLRAESPVGEATGSGFASREGERGYVVLGEREPGPSALSGKSLSKQIRELPEVSSSQLKSISKKGLDELTSVADRSESNLLPEEREAMSEFVGSNYTEMRAAENGSLKLPDESLDELKAQEAKQVASFRSEKGGDHGALRQIRAKIALHESPTKSARFIDAADKSTVLNPTEKGPLYRGMGDLPKQAMHELLDHDEFITAASTSSSYNPETAKSFMSGDGNSVLFKIEHQDAGSIAPLGKQGAGEQEVVLPRGAKYKVIKREQLADAEDSQNVIVVTVKQIGWAKPHEMQGLGALGFADTGVRGGLKESLKGLATSPLGLTVGAGALATGGIYAKNKTQAYFENIDSDPAKAYAKVKGAIETLAEHPDQLVDSLTAQFGNMPHEAPDLFQNVAVQAQNAVAFLKDKLPPAFQFSLLYPDGPPPSRTDMLQLSLYWRGVTDPRGVVQRIGNGTAMPEEVEAFRAVSPNWFDELRETTVIKAQERARQGHALGAFKIAQLEGTLDLAGQLDPTFSDTVSQIYQTSVLMKDQEIKQPGYVPPPKASQRFQQKGTI